MGCRPALVNSKIILVTRSIFFIQSSEMLRGAVSTAYNKFDEGADKRAITAD